MKNPLLDQAQKQLSGIEFRICLKWQRQMQVQHFEPMTGTLCNFQDFCKHLESALDAPPADNRSNKTPRQEKNKKRCQNNSNNEDKKHYCMLHGHNLMHSTKQCCTLKKGSNKMEKRSQNGGRKKKVQL